MKTDEFAVKCGNCDQEYNDEFFLNLCKKIHFAFIPDNGFYKLNFSCSNCQNQIYAKFQGEAVRRINDAINGTMVDIEVEPYDPDEPYEPDFDDAWLDSLEDELPESCEASSFQEHLDDLVVPLPQFVEENTHESANGSEKPDTVKDEGDTKNKIELFKDEIESIDKNLPDVDRTPLIIKALDIIKDEPGLNRESCLKFIKDEFNYTERFIEPLRKELNAIRKEAARNKEREKYAKIKERFSTKPKELTEQEKQEALTYLQHPSLLQNISRDLAFAGGIVGEETNKMMLYFAAISRKFQNPISMVIFGKSSSGKSFLANAIKRFVPPEDRLVISSSSARAFDYLGEDLKHKFVLVQEWEGVENILPTIRVIQSEGKLTRLVSVKDPDSDTHKSISVSQECPCSVVITTTKEGIHDENSTRIFELYADESIIQTQNVVRQNILNSSLKYKQGESEKKRILNLHHNIQRLLESVEVDIPFADHLNFPAKTTRNRRDSQRFIQLIKAVAFPLWL